MTNGQVQIQQLAERQLQKLTPQQLLNARLIELPIVELEDRVKTELLDNIALEEGRDHDETAQDDEADIYDDGNNTLTDEQGEGDGQATLYDEEDIPVYTSNTTRGTEEERPVGDTRSFLDYLHSQINDFDISPTERDIIEVLIGSLNENGFIDRSIDGISDDLLFKFNTDASRSEIEAAIQTLQKFEPAGIGARNLQECLLIQIRRQLADSEHLTPTRREILQLEQDIISNHFDSFKQQDTASVTSSTGAGEDQVAKAFEAISRLNPRPGLALSESADTGYQAIIPDFIIETSPDGNINIELNHGEVPELRVSRDYSEQLKQYQKAGTKLNRGQMEAFEYTRMKVEGARMFIESVKQRQRTLMQTMRAIVRLQRDFILTGDDSQLHTMRLADVAELAHIDISTVSRVRKDKYALVDGRLYPLDIFFLRSRTNADGETLSHQEVKQALREIIDAEDKTKPYSDQALEEELRKRGHNISRRTVAKYRNEMGIAAAQYRIAAAQRR